MMYDIIVIGKGLVGCATAKYLCRSNLKVALIGPDEPEDLNESRVFASHYDSGRVLRQLGKNAAMTALNHQAHKEYPVLKLESGIDFHKSNGCLYVNPTGIDDYLLTARERANAEGVTIDIYERSQDLSRKFPFFKFPEESVAMFESGPSGHINPRLLIEAQLQIVMDSNGIIISDFVESIRYGKKDIRVTTGRSGSLYGKKVVFAMGAFTNQYDLLQPKLDLTLKGETVLLAQIERREVNRLKKMPSLLYELNTSEIEGVYATQPIKYPDGKYYLKIGANLPEDIFFDGNYDAIREWFVKGESDPHIEILQKTLCGIMPDVDILNASSRRCILTRTRIENPYIGVVEDGRSYCAVGNGWCGGNSDGVGYVVAELAIHNEFPIGFDQDDFQPVYL